MRRYPTVIYHKHHGPRYIDIPALPIGGPPNGDKNRVHVRFVMSRERILYVVDAMNVNRKHIISLEAWRAMRKEMQ